MPRTIWILDKKVQIMKTRATITIAGDVQEVGFRALVMRLGQKMGVTGYVENLFDGTVKAVCEGEKSVIENFAKKIKIKDDVTDVEKIEIVYSKPKNEFKGFRVKITDQGSEMFQGFATAGRLLTELRGDVRTGNAELKEEVKHVGSKVDRMANRMDDNFNKMGQKYHIISQEVKTTNENLTKLVENFTLLVKDYVETKEKQK